MIAYLSLFKISLNFDFQTNILLSKIILLSEEYISLPSKEYLSLPSKEYLSLPSKEYLSLPSKYNSTFKRLFYFQNIIYLFLQNIISVSKDWCTIKEYY